MDSEYRQSHPTVIEIRLWFQAVGDREGTDRKEATGFRDDGDLCRFEWWLHWCIQSAKLIELSTLDCAFSYMLIISQ